MYNPFTAVDRLHSLSTGYVAGCEHKVTCNDAEQAVIKVAFNGVNIKKVDQDKTLAHMLLTRNKNLPLDFMMLDHQSAGEIEVRQAGGDTDTAMVEAA